MKSIKLKNTYQSNATLISNDFIDHDMIKANGEFVKVYLFLLRHAEDPCCALSISSMADYLDITEKDVLRAFRYWESEGLLNLKRDAHDNIVGIDLVKDPVLPETIQPAEQYPLPDLSEEEEPAVTSSVAHREEKAILLDSFKEQKELKNLFFIAEQYLGKTLTKTDTDDITYFYETLGMSSDLIEYLLESCVESGHKSMHYIKTVAFSWADRGIQTVEEAQMQSQLHSVNTKNCYTVLNALGIHNREPVDVELDYVKNWTDAWGFSMELIQEACNRTMSAIHQPSFEYTNKILETWYQNQVHSMKDVTAMDEAYQKEESSKKTAKQKSAKNQNNFDNRSYDMDSLEERLLNSN